MTDYKLFAQEICGDQKKVEELLKELHELKRTRDEAEAQARLQGYREGAESVLKQLRVLNIEVMVKHAG